MSNVYRYRAGTKSRKNISLRRDSNTAHDNTFLRVVELVCLSLHQPAGSYLQRIYQATAKTDSVLLLQVLLRYTLLAVNTATYVCTSPPLPKEQRPSFSESVFLHARLTVVCSPRSKRRDVCVHACVER